ncbi:hypothetical protein CGRA01v4_07219 [Colletotrichum graminicola]|nr:hypothetical protein CGRA01v4_07219 [Colletotrichum graminicola]
MRVEHLRAANNTLKYTTCQHPGHLQVTSTAHTLGLFSHVSTTALHLALFFSRSHSSSSLSSSCSMLFRFASLSLVSEGPGYFTDAPLHNPLRSASIIVDSSLRGKGERCIGQAPLPTPHSANGCIVRFATVPLTYRMHPAPACDFWEPGRLARICDSLSPGHRPHPSVRSSIHVLSIATSSPHSCRY